MSDPLSQAPELLRDLGDHVSSILHTKAGLDETQARTLARSVVDTMRKAWGGQLVYFPKGESIDNYESDLELWSKFTGNNHADLARDYDISLKTVYRRLRNIQKIIVARNQPDLFGE